MAESETNESTATIRKAMNQYNLLQIRLDTSEIINQAKMYLNAEVEVPDHDANGQIIGIKTITLGFPKCNKKGVASILNWLQMTINPQVVQGNFPSKNGDSLMYDQYIYEFQIDLMDMLMINLYSYEIDEDEVQSVVDAIMNIVKPFMTRLIGNKERESYGETFKEISSSYNRSKGGVPLVS